MAQRAHSGLLDNGRAFLGQTQVKRVFTRSGCRLNDVDAADHVLFLACRVQPALEQRHGLRHGGKNPRGQVGDLAVAVAERAGECFHQTKVAQRGTVLIKGRAQDFIATAAARCQGGVKRRQLAVTRA